jgi:hypothetical protein
MIDNAYSLQEVADFMDIDIKSLKQMNAKRRLPFPLTPVNNGKQKIYCVYKEHWEMALEKSANDSMKQLKADMESLEFEG